jgi:cell volume regulation protein A
MEHGVIHEPEATGVLLVGLGILLFVCAAFSRVSRILGIPVVLLFLAMGMLAGSEGLGGIAFEDYALTFRIGTIALALILFDGGLNTPLKLLRRTAAPASVLATAGVVGTAMLVGALLVLLGRPWGEAFLVGAIVSSTDAAAVFSVLRGGSVQPRARVGATIEAESGLNDPMAVILTITLSQQLLGAGVPWPVAAAQVVLQLVIGGVLGLAIGFAGRFLVQRIRPAVGGLYPVLTLAIAFAAFGVPTVLGGNGFLAVYVAGLVLGSGNLPFRGGVLRVHDAAAWLGQITMFLAMGLLVFPSDLPRVAGVGIVVALALVVVIRPAVVMLCLAPFRYSWTERLYIAWMGLRGAVPIILGTYPVLAGVSGGERIFDLVFFVVVVSTLLQGGTARWATLRLGLGTPAVPAAPALIEMSSARPLRTDLVSFHVARESAVCGVTLADIPFPDGVAPVLLIRGTELLAPGPAAGLEPGDHLYVMTAREHLGMLQLLFGQAEEG